jgi:hypothetical protein
MSPVSQPVVSRKLAILTAVFILSFFTFFTYSGLTAYFTFDDGTTIIAALRLFETSFWSDLLHILTVFTAAFRPLTTMFWRPLYAVFGFNPLPYRIAMQLLMAVNIGLAYVVARRVEMTREAAALTALIFCYNASTSALYYDTCLIGDVLCLLFYALAVVIYAGGRQSGSPLSWQRTAGVAATYFLALDSKEVAVTLPGILLVYELLYRHGDFRDRKKALLVGWVPAAMLVAGGIYLKVKVADMSSNPAYHPTVTPDFVLKNIGFYLQQLLYLPENSVTALKACLILAGLIFAGAWCRSRPAIFGVLFFVAALIPVAVIASRSGYAAYVAYLGLSVTLGALLAGARERLTFLTRRQNVDIASAGLLFVCVAGFLGWAHMVRRMPLNGYFEWDKPKLVKFMDDLQRNIPEFPPHVRVLMKDDVWDPDWGPMFLLRLMYHDNTIWLDRPGNQDRPLDPASYDLVVQYKAPEIEMFPLRFGHWRMPWEIRGKASVGTGLFEVTSPNAHGAASHLDFAASSVRNSQTVAVTMPGLANVKVNALFRIVSGRKTVRRLVENWCTLDGSGRCTITAPETRGTMIVDWIQPARERWILTRGTVTITE